MTMQQIAKILEVVQDVLVLVCSVQNVTNESEKERKLNKCVEKIKQNKVQAAKAYQSQLEE